MNKNEENNSLLNCFLAVRMENELSFIVSLFINTFYFFVIYLLRFSSKFRGSNLATFDFDVDGNYLVAKIKIFF